MERMPLMHTMISMTSNYFLGSSLMRKNILPIRTIISKTFAWSGSRPSTSIRLSKRNLNSLKLNNPKNRAIPSRQLRPHPPTNLRKREPSKIPLQVIKRPPSPWTTSKKSRRATTRTSPTAAKAVAQVNLTPMLPLRNRLKINNSLPR